MNISLCMIVKNEEQNLEACLKNVKDKVDEIIIVDTGSEDNTRSIAIQFTDRVYDFQWCNDFSAARNFSIEKASNEWVLILDADEVITDFETASIERFINGKQDSIGRIKRVEIFEDETGIKNYFVRISRLFNKKYFHYEGIIHEQVVGRDGQSQKLEDVAISADHVGYMKEVLNRTGKIDRNLNMLIQALKADNRNPYLHYQLGKTYFISKRYGEAVESFESAMSVSLDYKYEYVEDLVESYGYSLLNSGQYEKALKMIENHGYYKTHTDFLFLSGLVYMNNARFEQAVNSFELCIGNNEGNMEGVNSYLPSYNIAVIYDCLGHRKEALGYYKRCGNYAPAIKRIKELR